MARKSKKSPETDLNTSADKATSPLSASGDPIKKSPGLGQVMPADEAKIVMSRPGGSIKKSSGSDPVVAADKALRAMSGPDDPINAITLLYRDYSFAQEQRKRMDLALGAYLRRALGWQKDLPEKQRNAIAKQAEAIAKDALGTPFYAMVSAQNEGRACFDAVEADALKAMTKLAEGLPVWKSWGEDIRGFGAKSLAVIVAEAGDLSNYSDKSKLWKRMGLAVMGEVRQGGLKKGSGAEAWIEHGYSPKRRSQMWNVGDTMIKAQVRKVKDDADEDSGERTSLGQYGQAYLDRKAYELARDPEIKPIVAHRRAQRYMEKRLLKHLWQAWRGASFAVSEKTRPALPPRRNQSGRLMSGKPKGCDPCIQSADARIRKMIQGGLMP